ncbi:unnamed protein product [Adineta steineri]|uniref:Protein tincar-like n=1 Tax=Adineta steineri TaxID=433720 RepID=A0A819H1X3_9BILA|nr:unnamed protein product [Adineta steineri]
MVRAKFISLSRIWYTIIVVIIHLILIYFGIKYCYFNDQLPWPRSSSSSPKYELLIQKICILTSLILLFIFIYPALFQIKNLSNDNQQLTIHDFNKNNSKNSKTSLCTSLWHHCFSLSSTLHLIMSFLIIISTVLIDAKQIMIGLKDSALLWRTDFDLLFDWSPSLSSSSSLSSPIISSIKRLTPSNTTTITTLSQSFSIDFYSRLSLFNFLFASFICILREPYVFWSISKIFSIIYSFALALNVIQWCLMYSAFQLLIKNICFNTIESTQNIGYLLVHQPYTTFFLYLLLEFLIYISSLTFYYYGYNRFKYHENFNCKTSCYDRCSNYCPSLIAIIILLLYTSCKMPLVHDIFLLYIQTHLNLLFLTFIFEIIHVLLILVLWIYLTTKVDWNFKKIQKEQEFTTITNHGLTVKNTPVQTATAISLPDLNGNCSLVEKSSRRLSDNLYQKPYEKIRIFQSEIYYRNRPKNWSLPLNQQPTMMATFDDNDDDVEEEEDDDDDDDDDNDENDFVLRSTSYPTNETQYRDAIRKTVTNLYKLPIMSKEIKLAKEISSQNNKTTDKTAPMPSIKRFPQEQVEAARLRGQQMIIQQKQQPKPSDYTQHHRSATLLVSQV